MSNQFMTERLEIVILARLSTSARPLTDAALASELARYAPSGGDGARWGERVAGCMRDLAGRGLVDSGGRVARADELKRRTGAHAIQRWQQWSERALPGLALGVRADDARAHKRLTGRDAWSAAIVARAHGLWSRGAPPSPAELCDAVIWRALGLASKPGRCPGELRAHFLRGYIEIDGPPERMLRQLAAKLIGAPRVELRAIHPALIRAWLGGSEPAAPAATARGAPADDAGTRQAQAILPSGEPAAAGTISAEAPIAGARSDVDEGALIDAVRGAAREARDGVFGDRKVFIASVWNALRMAPPWSALGIDEFKSRLILAFRRRELELARADLVAAMDPALVASSETRIEGATFHFIVREPVQ